jgi:hypothetical protein
LSKNGIPQAQEFKEFEFPAKQQAKPTASDQNPKYVLVLEG